MSENTTTGVTPEGAESDDLKGQIAALTERLAKYERDNVVEGKFTGEVPRYKLNLPCYLEDDTLHVEGEEIEYLGCPNEEMVPLNDAARAKMQTYLEYLNNCAREAAETNGRRFTGRITDHGTAIAQALQDARAKADKVVVVKMPEEKGPVAQMPHTPDAMALQRRRGRPPKSAQVVSTKAPEPPKKQGPVPVAIIGSNYTADAATGRHGR